MSVINQVLLDLDKRRASVAARGKVPNYVRALPQAKDESRTKWHSVLGVAVLIAIATWAAVTAFERTGSRSDAREAAGRPLATPIAKAIATKDEAVLSPPEAALNPVPPAEMQLAARSSSEFSRLPDPLPGSHARPAVESSIASARVIARAPAEVRAVPAQTAAVEMKPPESRRAEQNVVRRQQSPAVGRAGEAPAIANPGAIDKRLRQPTAQQLAEGEFRTAMARLHQGRIGEARQGFEAALNRYPGHHSARQALLGVLVGTKQNAEAERVMQEGLQLAPHQIGFAMALARLQVDRGDSPAAIATLQTSLPHAQGNGDYLVFLAGLLQREQRNGDAIEQFQAALRLQPNNGVWLLGLGMSLQALDRDPEAQDAFRRARAANNISPELSAFAEQRLKQIE